MRSCINRVRKFFGKSSLPEPAEQMEEEVHIVQYEKTQTNQNNNKNNDNQLLQLNDKALKYNEIKNQDKHKEVVAATSINSAGKEAAAEHLLLTANTESQEPANTNAYIKEYKTFVEEKQQQLMSASTPYTTSESFDFEQLFNQNSRRYSEAQTLSSMRHAAREEPEYLASMAAESVDIVTPLPSEQAAKSLRPVTLPRCYALPLEFTEALRKLGEKSDSESQMKRLLSLSRHGSQKKHLEKHLICQQSTTSTDYSYEDEHEVILRRSVPEQKLYGNRSCSLFERRLPNCPKLKLALKSASMIEVKQKGTHSFDSEVFMCHQ